MGTRPDPEASCDSSIKVDFVLHPLAPTWTCSCWLNDDIVGGQTGANGTEWLNHNDLEQWTWDYPTGEPGEYHVELALGKKPKESIVERHTLIDLDCPEPEPDPDPDPDPGEGDGAQDGDGDGDQDGEKAGKVTFDDTEQVNSEQLAQTGSSNVDVLVATCQAGQVTQQGR